MPTAAKGRVTGGPPRSPCPSVGGRSPATIRSSVDLPQPLGPTSATNSPRPTAKEMSRRASTGPLRASYVIPTRSSAMKSGGALIAPGGDAPAAYRMLFGSSIFVRNSFV